jgi:hypothetical protein
LLWTLAQSERGSLRVGNNLVTPEVLDSIFSAVAGGEEEQVLPRRPLLILSPAILARETDDSETPVNAFAAFERFAATGLVGTWHALTPPVATRCGQMLLQGLLADHKTAGETLTAVRQTEAVAAALCFASCPADLKLASADEDSAAAQTIAAEPLPLPDVPYQPLQPLDAATAMLLVGREWDTVESSRLLDESVTRLLLMHGPVGTGKSSLVRAGILPYLEERCIGYRALRQRTPEEGADGAEAGTPASELDYPVAAIRATSDLAGQIAQTLLDFCDQPLSYSTPAGGTITVDLPALLQSEMGAEPAPAADSTAIQAAPATTAKPAVDAAIDAEDLRLALRQEPDLLGRIVTRLTEQLPFELVLVIEQGEELFTLDRPVDVQLAMLRGALASAARARFLVSLRTEYAGRLLDGLTPVPDQAVRTFFVPELGKDALVEIVLQPTSMDPLPGTDEAPQERYRF